MRLLPPLGLLLDVDGPLASTQTRQVPPSVIQVLTELIRRGVPVVFNTGRSADFVLQELVTPLRQAGLGPQARVHAVCEKGAVWFSATELPEGALPRVTGEAPVPEWIHQDRDLAVPAEAAERLAAMVQGDYAEIMFLDRTKLTAVSAEMTVGLDLEEYEPDQQEYSRRAEDALVEAGIQDDFQVEQTIISVDVEHRSSGKALGARRALELVGADGELPVRWITAGDSRSDYAMAHWLHGQGARVTHADVRPGDGVPDVDFDVLTPAGPAEAGFGRAEAIHEEAGEALLRWALAELDAGGVRL